MALLLGLEVTEVRIDKPEADVWGWCATPRNGRDLSTGDLAVTLAGGMVDLGRGATEFPLWPPPWPVLDGRGDQGRAHWIIKALGMPEPVYWFVVEMTADIISSPEFDRTYRHLTVALQQREVLGAAEIKQIAAPHLPKETATCST